MHAYLLLISDVRPGKLLLEFVCLMTLLAGLARLFKASRRLLQCGLEVGQSLLLLRNDLGRLRDVLHTCIVFLGELRKLRPAKEELGATAVECSLWQKRAFEVYLVFIAGSRGAEKLPSGICNHG